MPAAENPAPSSHRGDYELPEPSRSELPSFAETQGGGSQDPPTDPEIEYPGGEPEDGGDFDPAADATSGYRDR